MHPLVLLLIVTSTLVLRSGNRIAVEGSVHQENGVVKFRSAGVLYSLPADEVERIETAQPEPEAAPVPAVKPAPLTPKRLRLSDEERRKKIAALAENHSGTPAPPQAILQSPPPPPSPAEVAQQTRDEWAWRHDAREHEEAVRRAQEELQLIRNRIEELESRIQSFVAQGFKPRDFTYDSSQLVRERERIPYAQLEVERAQRANEQFREDARRQGVLPGWLR
jgi:hypothetical protein